MEFKLLAHNNNYCFPFTLNIYSYDISPVRQFPKFVEKGIVQLLLFKTRWKVLTTSMNFAIW